MKLSIYIFMLIQFVTNNYFAIDGYLFYGKSHLSSEIIQKDSIWWTIWARDT